jgi:hypothetical protein
MYTELFLAEVRLAELRGNRLTGPKLQISTHGLPAADIPRPNARIKHEVFRRIVKQ